MNSIVLPRSQVFDLLQVHSFPLLEDLTVISCDCPLDADDDPHGPQTVVPSTSPAFTGALALYLGPGIEHMARRLLSLPAAGQYPLPEVHFAVDLRRSPHLHGSHHVGNGVGGGVFSELFPHPESS